VLLGQIDGEPLDDLTSVTTESTEQGTVTVHDNETELLVSLEQFTQCLGVELVVTQVERSVDGLERLEVNVNFALLSFRCDNFTTVYDKSIGGDLVVELETLLGRSNGRQHGETVHTRLNVGGGTLDCAIRRRSAHEGWGVVSTYILFSQHLGCSANLILGG
jgi:hypothetical protein